jgi:hypothetical protein
MISVKCNSRSRVQCSNEANSAQPSIGTAANQVGRIWRKWLSRRDRQGWLRWDCQTEECDDRPGDQTPAHALGRTRVGHAGDVDLHVHQVAVGVEHSPARAGSEVRRPVRDTAARRHRARACVRTARRDRATGPVAICAILVRIGGSRSPSTCSGLAPRPSATVSCAMWFRLSRIRSSTPRSQMTDTRSRS